MRATVKLALFVAVSLGALALSAAPAEAQRGRPGRGHGGGTVVFIGGYYRPFFDVYPWYPYPFYPYQSPGFPPYAYGYYGPDPATSVRLEVKPRETEVYVDGYLAGVVDDFDGFFQRLRLPPGAHEIVLYLDGYYSVRQDLHLSPGGTYKIRHQMVRLGSGEAAEPRPVPATPPPQNPPTAGRRGPAPASGFSTLAVRVQPANAEVLIDGERWQGPEGQDRLMIQVSEGRHQVEIRKEGYQSFSTQVQTRAGETENLNVSLPPLDRR